MKRTLFVIVMCFIALLGVMFTACNKGHKHDFSGEWDHNEAEHWRKCTDETCTEIGEKSPHDFGTDGKCECGYENPDSTHKHDFTGEWDHNETEHWRKCTDKTCTEIGEKSPHDFGTDGKCVCGYEKTDDTHKSHDFTSGVYKKNAAGHQQKCTGCDEYDAIEAHTFDTDGKTCTKCGYVKDHTHSYTSSEYLRTPEGHQRKCTGCDEYSAIEAHTFGPDGLTCTKCGYVKENISEPDDDILEELGGTYETRDGYNYTIVIEDDHFSYTGIMNVHSDYTITGYSDGIIYLLKSDGITTTIATYNKTNLSIEYNNLVFYKKVPHEHNLTLVPKKPATCSATGLEEHKECDGCDLYFDKEGNEIDKDELIIDIDPNAHSFTGEWKPSDDGHQRQCAYCDELSEKTGHVFNDYNICECGYEKTDAPSENLLKELEGKYKSKTSDTDTIVIEDDKFTYDAQIGGIATIHSEYTIVSFSNKTIYLEKNEGGTKTTAIYDKENKTIEYNGSTFYKVEEEEEIEQPDPANLKGEAYTITSNGAFIFDSTTKYIKQRNK